MIFFKAFILQTVIIRISSQNSTYTCSSTFHFLCYKLFATFLLCTTTKYDISQPQISRSFVQSLYSKKKLLLPPPPINEKTNSFRNTKFGVQIAFSMKMCKMSSSKIKDQWGPRGGPHNLKSSEILYRLLSKFGTTFHWNTGVR